MESVHSDIGLQYSTKKNPVEIAFGCFIAKASIPARFSTDQIVILKDIEYYCYEVDFKGYAGLISDWD